MSQMTNQLIYGQGYGEGIALYMALDWRSTYHDVSSGSIYFPVFESSFTCTAHLLGTCFK